MGKDALQTGVVVERENPRVVTRGCNSQNLKGASKNATARISDAVGVHWLRGTLIDVEQAWLTEYLCRLFGPEYQTCEYGFWSYDRHLAWPCGAMVLYHSTDAGSRLTDSRIAVEIPGRGLETLEPWELFMFCTNLRAHGFRATRIDAYFDDAERVVTPSQLYATVYEASLFDGLPIRADFSGFRVIRQFVEAVKDRGRTHDEVSFGRRGSTGTGKYLRVYDKALESQGLNGAVRWELETSDEKANRLFSLIVDTFSDNWRPAQTVSVIAAVIGGCIDFKRRTQRAGDKNLDRLERYEFWQRILSKIGCAKLAGVQHVKTIEKARQWVARQCAGTLQMLHAALGAETFLPLVVEICTSEDHLRPEHEKAIAEYRRTLTDPDVNIVALRTFCDANGVPLEGPDAAEVDKIAADHPEIVES
jgi:hypothetical protein